MDKRDEGKKKRELCEWKRKRKRVEEEEEIMDK